MQTADVKCCLLGQMGSGKTCLFSRTLYDSYGDDEPTIQAGMGSKSIQLPGNDQPITLRLWDTAGQERFKSLTIGYVRGADACLLCHDLTDASSFRNLDSCLEVVKSYAPHAHILLVGTKADLVQPGGSERAVQSRRIKDFAARCEEELSAPDRPSPRVDVCETSALANYGVSELFVQVAEHFVASGRAAKRDSRADESVPGGSPGVRQSVSFIDEDGQPWDPGRRRAGCRC
jgi:small GTP-binding protein